MVKKGLDRYDLFSLGIIIFVVIFQISRFNYLPQFIDDYYHLHVAENFLKSGGWVGVSFWDYAPIGRPHLYPPFYHFLIAGLLKLGFSPLTSLKILGVSIPVIFFLVLWLLLRGIFSTLFSFLAVLVSFSSFSFYMSLDANIPATLGIIFFLFSLFFLRKNRVLSSSILLAFCIYTHSGISLSFIISLIIFCLVYPEKTKILKVVSLGVFLGACLFAHQLRYIKFLEVNILKEAYFTHYNFLIITLGLAGLFSCLKRRGFYSWILGITLGFEIVFLKYPYRFFSAQGLFSLCLLSASFLESVFLALKSMRLKRGLFLLVIFYSLFINSSMVLEEGKPMFRFLNSTFSELSTGRFYDFLKFRNFIYPKFFSSLEEVILGNTEPTDIISSNIKPVAVLLGSLTNRAISTSIFAETKSFLNFNPYLVSKLIIWIKSPLPRDKEERLLKGYVERFKWEKIFENDIAYVYKNMFYFNVKSFKSPFPFPWVFLAGFLALGIILLERKMSF